MSYAGKDSRSRRTGGGTAVASSSTTRGRRASAGERVRERELSISARGASDPTRSRSSSNGRELDWQHIALFTAGALLGAAMGAGAALLFAPHSGARTRHDLARQGRHLRTRTTDAWDDLRHELRYATRRGRRKLARAINRALQDRRERRALKDESLLDG
jgi:gas vesicle protein